MGRQFEELSFFCNYSYHRVILKSTRICGNLLWKSIRSEGGWSPFATAQGKQACPYERPDTRFKDAAHLKVAGADLKARRYTGKASERVTDAGREGYIVFLAAGCGIAQVEIGEAGVQREAFA